MRVRTPFRLRDEAHDSIDPVCLAPADDDNPDIRTFEEFYEAALVVIDAGLDQPAFAVVRQLAELELKLALAKTGLTATGHDLDDLLTRIPRSHPIHDPNDPDADLLRCFITALHEHDSKGDSGRYGRHASGEICLEGVCCIERDELAAYAYMIHTTCAAPVSHPNGTGDHPDEWS